MMFSKPVTLLGLAASPAAAFFMIPCKQLAQDCIDPLVNPGGIADHLHQFTGGEYLAPYMPDNATAGDGCTSCHTSLDMSNYWTATMMVQSAAGDFKACTLMGTSVYYFTQQIKMGKDPWPPESPPRGLRYLTGDASLRSDDGSHATRSINYKCMGSGDAYDLKTLPPTGQCAQVRSEIVAPPCWDGKHLDTEDHRSHMAYPDGPYDGLSWTGTCPPTHPHHLPSIRHESLWECDQTPGGQLTWSNGDQTGYSCHLDIWSGWNPDDIGRAIRECPDQADFDFKTCSAFQGTIASPEELYSATSKCKVKPFTNKVFEAAAEYAHLPRCNQVKGGPEAVVHPGECDDGIELMGDWASEVPSYEGGNDPVGGALGQAGEAIGDALGQAGEAIGNGIKTVGDTLTVTSDLYVDATGAPVKKRHNHAQAHARRHL